MTLCPWQVVFIVICCVVLPVVIIVPLVVHYVPVNQVAPANTQAMPANCCITCCKQPTDSAVNQQAPQNSGQRYDNQENFQET